ncbi:redoxin domain-containing protein [Novosphingobium flavum]|uniref:Redoxin domain-containing protein n=1 Tax=Novosphingobium flavum TaxID=1778672 RepID=A0A7X1FTF5_9SPHN|nr:redoxin domain-containing protein [Novosphingobium flavum]MBC2666670.1 redoxin domain-containing protein [Novosphingobium flavum]
MTANSLAHRFRQLQAERERTWTQDQLAANAAQRRLLVERDDPSSRPAAGHRLAPFEIIDESGQALTSHQLLAKGPVALVYFRFGGCPACNIALPYYDETLRAPLARAGLALAAISPQVPVDPGPAGRQGLSFPTYGDPHYGLARQLGLTFFPEDQPSVQPSEAWIGATLGTDSYEMAKPAVIVIDPDHVIRFIDVSPDWLARTEATTVLAALQGASQV